MDDIDRQLLGLLRSNARTSVTALARALRLSRATVQSRMSKLEEEGIITSYTVCIKREAEPHQIRAWMSIAVEGNHANRVLRLLRSESCIHALHTTNGRWDILAEVRMNNLEVFANILDRVRQINGIVNTETSILLSSYKL